MLLAFSCEQWVQVEWDFRQNTLHARCDLTGPVHCTWTPPIVGAVRSHPAMRGFLTWRPLVEVYHRVVFSTRTRISHQRRQLEWVLNSSKSQENRCPFSKLYQPARFGWFKSGECEKQQQECAAFLQQACLDSLLSFWMNAQGPRNPATELFSDLMKRKLNHAALFLSLLFMVCMSYYRIYLDSCPLPLSNMKVP